MLCVRNIRPSFPFWVLTVLPIYLGISWQDRTSDRGGSSITGKVVDTSDHPISGVNVVLDSTLQGAVTDDSGKFSINNVRSGTHSLRVFMLEYRSITIDSVLVSTDKPSPFQIRLREAEIAGSPPYPGLLVEMGEKAADSDLAKGPILLLSPFSITKDESTFAKKHQFEFRTTTMKSGPYLSAYNARVNQFLTKRFGQLFIKELEAVWERNHGNKK